MAQQDYQGAVKRIGWTVMLLLVGVLVISAIEHKQTSIIKTLDISIKPLADSTLLIQQGDVVLSLDRSFGYRFDERSIKDIDVERIERVLEEEPFIKDADVYINAANIIKVSITQREPILRIIDKNGLNYYLDGAGYKMPLSKHFTTRTLVATGNIPPHVPDFQDRKKHTLKDLFILTQFILKDEFFSTMIEQVYVTNSGDFVFVPMIGDQKIIFGKLDRMEEKFRNLRAFYDRAIPVNGWRKYSTINLKFKGQVVCS
jgi:cell division protein FtsQ